MMHILNIAGDDSVAWVRDDVTGTEMLAFAKGGKVFGRAHLTALVDPEPFDYVLGPFAHVGALTDAFGFYLQGVSALAGSMVIIPRANATPVPSVPDLPGYRTLQQPAMHPTYAAAILLKLQECLDAGDAAMAAALRFEKDYAGDKVDDRDAASYARRLDVRVGAQPAVNPTKVFIEKLEAAAAAPAAPVGVSPATELLIPPLSSDEREKAEAKLFELPVISRRPSLRAQPIPTGASSARFPIGGERTASRLVARTPIDWSGLPVRVVEQRLTDEQSLLRADLVKRKRA
jgi:hypothetical protein